MLGQEDIFTQAMIESQLKQLDKQFDTILNTQAYQKKAAPTWV
jgi:hypothetical protein